jgi:probable rRNA maturation factor
MRRVGTARARGPKKRPTNPPRLRLALVGNARFAGLPSGATLRRWVKIALQADARITLVFVDARRGRALNRNYRGQDHATNVLTFAYERMPRVEADVVLCPAVVRREAREQAKSLREHLAHLVIHGVLHAQGYDHEHEREAARMQARERRLLAHLRIADPYSA